jgi:hypothetical protein
MFAKSIFTHAPREESCDSTPWLMPDCWSFPKVSMGLGPINAIYQARFMGKISEATAPLESGSGSPQPAPQFLLE